MSAEEEGEIRCICGFIHDDGFTIQCEKCLVWQHAVCVEITEETGVLLLTVVPELYFCEMCEPRKLDKEKAVILQGKRMKDSNKGKKLEEKKKRMERFEKPSPRKRKESPELGPKVIDGRKKKNKELIQSPLRKKFKDALGNDLGLEFTGQKPRGRPRLHSVPQILSRQNSPEPFIIRKKETSLEFQTRFSNSYESEYSCNLQIFASCSRSILTSAALEILKSIDEKSKAFPFYQVLDTIPNLVEKAGDGAELHNALSMLEDGISMNFKAVHDCIDKKFISGVKKLGLFAIDNMEKESYVCNIKGVICGKADLEKKESMHSLIPLCTQNTDSSAQLAPPFVFRIPDVEQNLAESLWMDAREFGGFDGRFVRSCCGANPEDLQKCNATLKLVWAIDSSESKDKMLVNCDKLALSLQNQELVDPPVPLSDRLRLCIFATKAIKAGEEIVLQPSVQSCNFSCVCDEDTSCHVNDTIIVSENFKRSRFGDPDIPVEDFYETLSTLEEKRAVEISKAAEKTNKELDSWNYNINQDELLLDRNESASIEYVESESEVIEPQLSEVNEESENQPEMTKMEMEELLFGEEPAKTIDSSFEDVEMEEGNPDTKDSVEFLAPSTPIKKEEPLEIEEEKIEPRRVSLRDFMKQKSFVAPTTDNPNEIEDSNEAVSNLDSSAAEVVPPKENLDVVISSSSELLIAKVSSSPEYQASEVGEISTTEQAEDTRDLKQDIQISPKIDAESAHQKPYSNYGKPNIDARESTRYNSDMLDMDRYGSTYESKGWSESDRGLRERRESEPLQGIPDDREFDNMPERPTYGRSFRESFPPSNDRMPREKMQYRSPTIAGQRDTWADRDHRVESGLIREPDLNISRMDSGDKRQGFRPHDRREDSWNTFDNSRDRYPAPIDRFQGSNERYPPSNDRFPPNQSDRFQGNSNERFPGNPIDRFPPNSQHQYSNRGRGRPYFPKPYYHQNYRSHENFNDRFGPPREQSERDRMYGPGPHPEGMHEREREFEWKKRDPRNYRDSYGRGRVDFVDTLEKTQLHAAHWASDEEDDDKGTIAGVFKQLSMLSTEFFILSRGFLDTIDEHLNHVRDILAMERELHYEIKCRIKIKKELMALAKKNPKVTPVDQDSMMLLEDKMISNYAKVKRKFEILDKSVQEKKVELMTIRQTRTPLVIKELLFQYSKVWDTFSGIYKSMNSLLKGCPFPKDKKDIGKAGFKIGYASAKQLQVREVRMETLKKWVRYAERCSYSWKNVRLTEITHACSIFNWLFILSSLNLEHSGDNSNLFNVLQKWIASDNMTSPLILLVPTNHKSRINQNGNKKSSTLNRISSMYSIKTQLAPGENYEADPVFKQVLQLFDDQVTLLSQIENREKDGTKYIQAYIDNSILANNIQKGQQSKQVKQKAMLLLESARYKVVSVMEENRNFRVGQFEVFALRKYAELVGYSKTLSQLYGCLEDLLSVQNSTASVPNLAQPEISVAEVSEKEPSSYICAKMATKAEDTSPGSSSGKSSIQGDTPKSSRPRPPSYSVDNVDSNFRGAFSRRTSSRNSLKKSNSVYSVPSISVQAHEFTQFDAIDEHNAVTSTIREPDVKPDTEGCKDLLSPERPPSLKFQSPANVLNTSPKSTLKNISLPPLNGKPPPPVPMKLARKRSNSTKH
ncbi:myeloid lymphoid or mixed-lineage leukemia 5 (trithorax, ) [Terramyces sp. JEL0728]|nr:myeloid lymphoid or mixed-lineage leukemia 5 (trithorax, ) [Terramyces sp. JEL0728]